MRLFPVILSLIAAFTFAACDGSSVINDRIATRTAYETPADAERSSLPTVEIDYGGGTITVEVARTPEERAVGLSGRDSLAEDSGMLFELEETRVPSFWMKDTNFPLDMIWIDEEKRVVSVTENAQPQPGVPDSEQRRYSPDEPVRYVLELNGGAARRLGIEPGAQLEFEL